MPAAAAGSHISQCSSNFVWNDSLLEVGVLRKNPERGVVKLSSCLREQHVILSVFNIHRVSCFRLINYLQVAVR